MANLAAVIESGWIGAHPTQRLDVGYWLPREPLIRGYLAEGVPLKTALRLADKEVAEKLLLAGFAAADVEGRALSVRLCEKAQKEYDKAMSVWDKV